MGLPQAKLKVYTRLDHHGCACFVSLHCLRHCWRPRTVTITRQPCKLRDEMKGVEAENTYDYTGATHFISATHQRSQLNKGE